MTINLRSKGGSGGFITRYVSGSRIIPSGASGDVLVLTPPAGQKVRLTSLGAVGTDCLDMTLKVGGETVVTSSPVAFDGITIGSFGTGRLPVVNTPNVTADFNGAINESITLTRVNGNTNSDIFYQYQFGE